MTKIGLIGCGFMGSMHAACYKALNANVAAVADIREEKAAKVAKDFNAEIYSDAKSLIENADVDTVDVCLPTYLHAEYAVLAMKKGKNLFLEKPVCLNMGEAQNLLSVQKETGAKVMVGQVIRLWDEYVYLKNTADSGLYGKLLSATFRRMSTSPTWAWDGWLHDVQKSGSSALDMHIHDVDFMRMLMGEPEDLVSMAQCRKDGTIDHIFTSYMYKDAVAHIECSWDYPEAFPFKGEYIVRFEKATITYENGKLTVYEQNGKSFNPEIAGKDVGVLSGGNISSLGGYYNELKYFTECLDGNRDIEISTLDESIRSLNLVLHEISVCKRVCM